MGTVNCCAVFGARPVSEAMRPYFEDADCIIAADGGFLSLEKLGVRPDFTGTITVLSATGSKVTYSARPAPWVEGEIPPGTEVLIVEIDEGEGVCVVCPMDVPRPANKK